MMSTITPISKVISFTKAHVTIVPFTLTIFNRKIIPNFHAVFSITRPTCRNCNLFTSSVAIFNIYFSCQLMLVQI